MRADEDAIKLFAISNQLIEQDLDRVERDLLLDLGRSHEMQVSQDSSYYPQIEVGIRAEAALMAPHYEVFYSLEKTIRALVSQTLQASDVGDAWWTSDRVPQAIRDNAQAAMQKELDSGITVRSDEMLDYTNFGDLSQIIEKNWDLFGSTFRSLSAVKRIMTNLNHLRGPIAHCSPLAEDEIVRLRLSVSDWFRQME